MFNNPELNDILDQFGQKDKEVGMEDVEIKNFNRLNVPLTLEPGNTTFEEIKLHALVHQYLGKNTVEKNLRYLRFMEHHKFSVNIAKPNRENFLSHIRYRLYAENPPATPFSVRHEWKAMRMLLKAYNLPVWDIDLPPNKKCKKRIIPLPEIVREFWHYKYYRNRYQRKLYQYMFFLSFMMGIRTPSELAILKTTDFIFNKNGTAIVTITETKKRNQERTIVLPKEIATDLHHKSIKNWLESWRPRVANEKSQDYLFLQKDGKPFTVRHLGHKLSENGRKVWEHFKPYVTRHWCAIAKLIEQKIENGTYDCYPVMNWLGHENIKTTMSYIRYAEQYYTIAQYNWIKRALKQPKLKDSTLGQKPTTDQKTAVLNTSSPVGEYGLGEACIHLQGEEWSRTFNFNPLLNTQSISFSFSFDLFNFEAKGVRHNFSFDRIGHSSIFPSFGLACSRLPFNFFGIRSGAGSNFDAGNSFFYVWSSSTPPSDDQDGAEIQIYPIISRIIAPSGFTNLDSLYLNVSWCNKSVTVTPKKVLQKCNTFSFIIFNSFDCVTKV